MNKFHKSKRKKLPQRFLQHAILKLLRKKPGKGYSAGNIAMKLNTKNSKDSIQAALEVLLAKGKVQQNSKAQYVILEGRHPDSIQKDILKGRVDLTSTGAAYIIVEGRDKDIFVPAKHLQNAMHGDIVKVGLETFSKSFRPKGKVVEVVERHRTRFIGTFQEFKKYGYVFVEAPKFSIEVRILPQDYGGANHGDSVVVDVVDFGNNRHQQLVGVVHTVLNPANRNDFEMRSILINNGFDIEFSEEVLKEAATLDERIHESDVQSRRDMREVLTFTIDPLDAKDFDDAISYQKLENGNTEIGVHIADVTHFVKPGTALDKEAYARSTSVYLVDRVCPMLPERISNELCSLRPNEDKFSFSVVFEFNPNNKLVNHWTGKTLIHSDRRFTYEEAQEVLDGQRDELVAELTHINRVAKKLNSERFNQGSINFESDEIRFELGEDAAPIRVYRKTRQDTNKLIEEFMLLANKVVAKSLSKVSKSQEIPFVYRVHDLPDNDRLIELALLASEFGIKLNFDTPNHIRASLNSLSEAEEDEDIRAVLRPMAIRCMAKAIYTTENVGHFGLGFEYYSHFTSPIRRYADVLAHRILYANLQSPSRVDKEILEGKCLHISQQERSAISAERESIKYKQVEYLSDQVGEVFEGVIRNIIDRGLFVELTDSQADGYIPMDSIDENVMIHPARIKITGQRSKKVWRIGDRIQVQLIAVDMDKRQIDLKFAESEGEST